MEFAIRTMTIDDYERVIRLWKETERIKLNESDTQVALDRFLQRNIDLSCVAVLPGGNLVGAVLCGHDGRRGYLHHLAVARNYRCRGIGKGLLKSCYVALQKENILACNITVLGHNAEGKCFWFHNGWIDRSDLSVMQKPLRTAVEEG